jgi:hypothetical protein
MSSHQLKLNPDKTELMWLGTPSTLSNLPNGGPCLALEICIIPVSRKPRSLGVIIDAKLGNEAAGK